MKYLVQYLIISSFDAALPEAEALTFHEGQMELMGTRCLNTTQLLKVVALRSLIIRLTTRQRASQDMAHSHGRFSNP
jgi:hypothetical protein